jgi:hypothetical protein
MIAPPVDLDLGPDTLTSKTIQNSLVKAWHCEGAHAVLMGLMWAYRDCSFDHAENETTFLWSLSFYL